MRIATRFLKPPPENSRIEIFNPDKSGSRKTKRNAKLPSNPLLPKFRTIASYA